MKFSRNGMKKLSGLLILLLLPIFCYGQFISLGGQYTEGANGQFAANLAYPTYHKKNKLNIFISSGIDYTTSGGAEFSGLNVKPIQINTFFSEKFINKTPFTILMGVDAGYLFDFRWRKQDGFVITPNIYCDYKFFFVKAGYDFDITNNRNQFFVRAGVSVGIGALKMIGNDFRIW